MSNDRYKILEDSIKRLLRRGACSHLKKIVNKTHAADLSLVFQSLRVVNQHKLFEMIDDLEQKGVLLSELDEFTFLEFIEDINLDEVVTVFEHMPADDVAALVGMLSKEKSTLILEKMRAGDFEEVEELLAYQEDTAGGIMVPEFIALKQDSTAKEAIEILQKEHMNVEMVFYLYVVDEQGRLVGVSSLRQLVVVKPDTPLKDFMVTDIFSVKTDTDQEEVARTVARYDILAVPVVDELNKLVGIVTVDDVIDVIREEATEDILKMAGVGDEFIETQTILRSTRIRLPWLFASCIGGIGAFFIIGGFEATLERVSYLAAFIPVIMGMGGNIGTQSSTIVVRGLATARINKRDLGAVVFKELSIGIILGFFYGLLIGCVAQVSYRNEIIAFNLAMSVGFAVFISMSVAALVGSIVPMLFARINVDPAVATGPFVTTSIDIVSVYFYFMIATTLIGL